MNENFCKYDYHRVLKPLALKKQSEAEKMRKALNIGNAIRKVMFYRIDFNEMNELIKIKKEKEETNKKFQQNIKN